MSDVKYFPGVIKEESEKKEEITPQMIVDALFKEHKLSDVIIIGITEGAGSVVVSGNTTITQGVYLMEVAKMILIEKASE